LSPRTITDSLLKKLQKCKDAYFIVAKGNSCHTPGNSDSTGYVEKMVQYGK
jgi:hypothetical protein